MCGLEQSFGEGRGAGRTGARRLAGSCAGRSSRLLRARSGRVDKAPQGRTPRGAAPRAPRPAAPLPGPRLAPPFIRADSAPRAPARPQPGPSRQRPGSAAPPRPGPGARGAGCGARGSDDRVALLRGPALTLLPAARPRADPSRGETGCTSATPRGRDGMGWSAGRKGQGRGSLCGAGAGLAP